MPAMLPDLIRDSVRRHPDAPAVLGGDRVVSYRELGRWAQGVAQALREHGVGPQSPVGILMAPGPGLVAALVGTWLAGACYVPIDPVAPPERQRRVLELADVAVLVTDGRSDASAAPAHLPLVRADLPAPTATGPGGAFPATDPTPPHHAAYMVFTSGSTGTPKGVVVEHAGIANLVAWAVRELGLSTTDRVLQKTPLTFDAATWEIFAPLVVGAPVVFGRPDAGRDAAALVASLKETGTTVLQVVPSLLRLLAVEPGLEACSTLRTVCSGGEPLHAELCRRLRERVDVEVWNTYGPTECSVNLTAARFDPEQRSGPVPIGLPIDGMRLRLPTADAEPGDAPPDDAPHEPEALLEVYAAGPGVARGYYKDPAQTAERFLPDPCGPSGTRMYRTGDLVRRRADGALVFVGRTDAQVKINGVRIEPGEAEAALARNPGVIAAAVAPVDDPGGQRRLGAWIVTTDGHEPRGLTTFLRDRLPPSLVPSVITLVAALPVTTSGKTDLSRLPEPDWSRPPRTGAAGAAAIGRASEPTLEQRLVTAAWQEVLKVDEVDLDDDFFRIGGHSLLMTRLAVVLAETSRVELDFRDLLLATTPRLQARLLAEGALARPIEALPAGARVPLSPGQERFWLQDRMSPGSPEYLLPVMVWLSSAIPEAVIREAVRHLVVRHEPLRTRYAMDADGLHAIVLPAPAPEEPAAVDFEVVDTDPDEVVRYVQAALAGGFDLTAAPPVRYRLIRGGDGEQLLLVVCHHIAGDGWSTRVLERDLSEFVRAVHTAQPPALDDLPVRYRDAVAWQRDRLTPDVAAEQLRYWRTALDGVPPLILPGESERPPHRAIAGSGVETAVTSEDAAALLALGRAAGVPAHGVFLTLWTVLLARAGKDWDFGVGTPLAGRDRPELHSLVGLFINVVVVRARLTPDMSFRTAIERVGQVCREAAAHGAVPFEQVAEAVEPVRDLSRTPVFQTLFTLSGDGMVGQEVGERDVRLLAEAWRVARTDVALTLWPRADGSFGGAVEYAVGVVSEDLARDLAGDFRSLAGVYAADPGTAVGAPWPDAAEETPDPSVGTQPMSATILAFVRDVLEQDDVGAEDDVLALGGNSLTVARLLWSVQNAFGVQVSMRAFFDRPTAAALADEVERLLEEERQAQAAPAP
ncbi:amino acid adenylation domain-containing protein [Streptomyces sp. NPDC058739]|uniref:amino acid adenylation domain-containing protein n=1 Tax=Streptomyces sp. NPDC058739 TaxID=3346618 RepID=UPI0036803CEF